MRLVPGLERGYSAALPGVWEAVVMYAGDEFYDEVTSGPRPGDYPLEGAVPTAVQNAWNDEYEEEEPRCVACDGPLDERDHSDSVCDDCSGLGHCIDDICYGQGYCMHVKGAWRP